MQTNNPLLVPFDSWNMHELSYGSAAHHDTKDGVGCDNSCHARVSGVAAADAPSSEDRIDLDIHARIFVSLQSRLLNQTNEKTAY